MTARSHLASTLTCALVLATSAAAQDKPPAEPKAEAEAKATAKATAKAPLPTLAPPLGRIGDVVQAPPQGGLPGGEKVVVATLAGCEEPRAFYLERFFTQGALGATRQVKAWLDQNPAVQKKLFGKRDVLTALLQGTRAGYFHEGILCPKAKPLGADGRITQAAAPDRLCKGEPGPTAQGGLWVFTRPGTKGALRQRDHRGAILLSPAPEGAKDACLPRLSAAVYDTTGKARVRYHADWNGAAQVEVLGDGCRRLHFTFDAEKKAFVPTLDTQPGCRRK